MICVVISRVHYSVDVVMGYWISSIIFSIYHGFCEVPHPLRPRNRPFRRLFLFWTMFELERNVPEGRLPNKLEWPFPWPKVYFVGYTGLEFRRVMRQQRCDAPSNPYCTLRCKPNDKALSTKEAL
ncbi:hypothetical protein COOONC_18959 [Cooperia oncophora]